MYGMSVKSRFKIGALLGALLFCTVGFLRTQVVVEESDARLALSGYGSVLSGKPFTGIAYSRYRHFRLQHLVFFWNGKITGTEYLWYPNGTVMAERPHRAGLPHGQWKMWYEDGSVKSLRNYVDGVIDGEMWGWHDNGQVSDFNVYDKGKEITHKSWVADGTPFYNYVYQDGHKVGMRGGDYCKPLKSILR